MTIESDSARFSHTLRSAIFWPIGVIFLTALLLLLLVFQLFQVVKWSDHSYEVIEQTTKCENQVISLQNKVRGYLITGKPAFLESFEQEHKEIEEAFARLHALVQDNSEQATRLEECIQAKDTWFEQARSVTSQNSQANISDAQRTMTGKKLMDDLVGKLEKFNAVEEGLRQQRLKRVRRMQQLLVYAGSGLFILLSLIISQLVRRQLTSLAGEYRSAVDTIQKRQAELEEQKEWFKVTLGSIGDGVIVSDEEGRVVFMNHEAELLTEWTSAQAHLKPLSLVFKIINEETRDVVEDPVAKVRLEKKVIGLANHTVLISSRGRECAIEDSAAPIYDVRGKMLGVILVFHDATDMRHAQKTLVAYSEDLEKKVAERTLTLQQTVTELEAFSYTISHDLRSPLRAMQGFAQAIQEDYSDKLDDRGKHYLDRIKNAAERLDRLIQDLLAYTRLAREEAPLVPLDLDKFVRDVIENYPHLSSSSIHMEIVGSLPKVMGREAALTQLLSNLLGNAAKFVASGTAPRIKIWSEDRHSRIRLWIQDNGIGIAQRDFERIFQMFIQINEPGLYSGTGIGLAIVKKAAQTMQGSVGLESEEGKGSKFWVELNRATT